MSKRLPLLPLLFAALPALAGGPINDNWSGRTAINPATLGSGFVDSQGSIGDATVEGTDPLLVCKNGDGTQRGNTVWYQLDLSAASGPTYINLSAAGYDSVVAVFTGNTGSGFTPVVGACNDDGGSSFAASLAGARLDPGHDYSILVARPSPNPNPATLGFSAIASPQYTVTKTDDSADGSCSAVDCSLREAISASNAVPGAVLIPAGQYTLTLSAASGENANATGDLDIVQGIGIYGAGAAATIVRGIQPGGNRERVFDVEPGNVSNRGITANFADLTIADASSVGPGGAINANGATSVAEHLALNGVVIRNNASTTNTGGGVHSSGPTVIANSTFSGNTSSSDGGGLALNGSVITRSDVFNSTFANNSANSDFVGGGGGIRSHTDLYVYNSTFSGNQARHSGGGLLSTTSNGKLTLLNVTLFGNRADANGNGGASGGGLRAEGLSAMVRNTAFGANLLGSGGGVAEDCAVSPAVAGSGNTSFLGNHLEVSSGQTTCPLADASNVLGTPALLGALADNGGSTQTHLPGATSPLIDSGYVADCLSRDQRGIARPQDGDGNASAICDKGAVEVVWVLPDPIFLDGFE